MKKVVSEIENSVKVQRAIEKAEVALEKLYDVTEEVTKKMHPDSPPEIANMVRKSIKKHLFNA